MENLFDTIKQYGLIDDVIQGHADEYALYVNSEPFNQLTKEQQALWVKDIKNAVISGGQCGIELAHENY